MAFDLFQICLPLAVNVVCYVSSLQFHTLHGDAGLSPLCDQDFELKIAACMGKGLDVVPQNLFENIERLDLTDNNITSLVSFSFERYHRIAYLQLSENDIRVIESTTFYPLKDLKYLGLSQNKHLVLPATSLFMWARKLSSLVLSCSNLEVLPTDTLKWIPHIETVDLQRNQFVSINIRFCGTVSNVNLRENQIERLTAESFTFVCRTDTLDLRENSIKSVDPDLIASLNVQSIVLGGYPMSFEAMRNLSIGLSRSHIKKLAITSAELGEFTKDMFAPMRDHSLSVLDLSNNTVNMLHPLVFSSLTRLNELNLSDNQVITVEPEAFERMQLLRALNLNYNKIQHINPSNHIWTVDLINLFLSGNLLTKVSSSAFLGLENLALLDLSSNERLVFFEITAFSGLNNIRTIDLSFCGISHFSVTSPTLQSISWTHMRKPIPLRAWSFKYLQSLEYVDLSLSDLYLTHIWDFDLNLSLFDGLMKLRTLNLSSNPNLSIFGTIPSGTFQQLSNLKELKLDYCYISSFDPLVFTALKSLQKLSLKGNKIQQIQNNLFKGMDQLMDINLGKNDLEYIDEAPFSSNTRLTEISLANNQLTRFNQSTFVNSSLTSVDISVNPIVCNCDLKWLFGWLKGPRNLTNEDTTVCSVASLETLRKKPLLHFDPDELCRHRLNNGLFTLIALAAICFVFIAVLLHHHRWHLRYKLFLLKLAFIGFKEEQDARDHNDYEFDVNVIFFENDEKWIHEQLRPALQERLPQFQRKIFGDEDLMLGMYYFEAVDYVINRSYKTIIVLSRAAVRDRWFMLKFRTAMDHVNDTHTEFVVVVLLEDLFAEELPFLARLYLNDGRPYLYWNNYPKGQEAFWGELVKKLNMNILTNDFIPNE